MKYKWFKLNAFFVILIVFIFKAYKILAISITVTGSWSLTIDETDLQAGAGSDLVAQYPSASNQVIVDITQTNRPWTVTIRGTVTNWHSDMRVWVRRTGDGNGHPLGSIQGGTSWQQVTLTDQYFFEGTRRRINVPIQLGVNGVSLQIPPDTYSSTIIYTVTEQ